MLDFMNITKALTDENRVRILMALRGRELCVCQITAFLDLAPSTTSKHLSVLRQARLIESRKHGKWVYYTLQSGEELARAEAHREPAAGSMSVSRQAQGALAWVIASLAAHPAVLADEQRIQHILQREEEICGQPEQPGAQRGDAYHSLELHSLATDYLPYEE